MHRETIKTMTSSLYLNANTTVDNHLYHSIKQNQQQLKAMNGYEIDHLRNLNRPLLPRRISSKNSNERAKSVDYSRNLLYETMPMASSSTYINTLNNSIKTTTNRYHNGTYSSTIYLDELHNEQNENELNLLNSRFGNYLDQIKDLANINKNLRRQVDNAYRKYMGYAEEKQIEFNDKQNQMKKYQNPFEIQLNKLRKQINDEVRAQTLVQIHLQRANYDIKFYQDNIQLLKVSDQKYLIKIRNMQQQLEVNLQELEQLKRQYENREQDLRMYKSQYNEYIKKLIDFSNEYDHITYERIENENNLSTLKEQLSFEQEYYHRRQQEFEYLEKFQYDFHKEFTKNELDNIVQQIRKDYQELNTIRLNELETLYKIKLDTIRNELIIHDKQQGLPKSRKIRLALDSTKQEHRSLTEQNQILKNKLEQLEIELQNIIEENRQHYELSDQEYQRLQTKLPELDYIILLLRENAISLWSEINTYRYLLLNLLSSSNDKSYQLIQKFPSSTTMENNNVQELKTTKSKINQLNTNINTETKRQYRDETTGFIVHIEDGIIWVRI